MVDGTYVAFSGGMLLIEPGDLTSEQISQLRDAVRNALEDGTSVEDFLDQHPQVVPLANLVVRTTTPRNVLLVLMVLLGLLLPYAQNLPTGGSVATWPTIARVIEHAEEQLHYHEGEEAFPIEGGTDIAWSEDGLYEYGFENDPRWLRGSPLPGDYFEFKRTGALAIRGWLLGAEPGENFGLTKFRMLLTTTESQRVGLL